MLQSQQQSTGNDAARNIEKKESVESIPSVVQGVWSNNPVAQLVATSKFRKLWSIGRGLPTDVIIHSGVIPKFVEFLDRHDFPKLQFEAAWVLTNFAAGVLEHTNVVVDSGAVPKFVKLLASASDDVREQAVLALGNIAIDSPTFRDLALCHGMLLPLLTQLNQHSKLSMLRNATWTLSNICCGKPPAPFEQLKPALPVLRELICLDDEEVLVDSCWALFYLSDGPNDKIQAVIEAGVVQPLIELLLHPSPEVLMPALRTVCNIVTVDDNQKQNAIDNGVLLCLLQLLTQDYNGLSKKYACRTISNITDGNRTQIQAVIETGLIHPLVCLLQSEDFDTRKEAAWALSNATCGGSTKQIRFLASEGCIGLFCDHLLCRDTSVVTACLYGLASILEVGESDKKKGMNGGVNFYFRIVDKCGGLETIKHLPTHGNNRIDEKVKFLKRILGCG